MENTNIEVKLELFEEQLKELKEQNKEYEKN